MNGLILRRSLGILLSGILASNLIPSGLILAQFQAGTIISIGAEGVENDYDFKDQLQLGDLTVDYQQVGSYRIEGGAKVMIGYSGGLMQNFDYSQGKITVTEKIVLEDSVIAREIIYDDGIPTFNVVSMKYVVKKGVYIDLSDLWVTLRHEKTIPELTNQLRSEEYKNRKEAVKMLSTLGQSAFSSLVTALKDSSGYVRECAAVALGRMGDPRAIKPLSSSLTDKSWYVRMKVAWALGQMKGNKQTVPLTEALKKEENEFVRAAISKALKRGEQIQHNGAIVNNQLISGLIAGLFGGVAVLLYGLLKKPIKCPKCGFRLPKFRRPQSSGQAMKGGWTCPECKSEVDRKGKLLVSGKSPE